MIQRCDTFCIAPTSKQHTQLIDMATNCAKLWNEITYERRQSFFVKQKLRWYPAHLYKKYSPLVGSATAQQVINKNNEAWHSFFALLKLQGAGKLPVRLQGRVRPVGYWKDKEGRYKLMVIARNDCYRIENNNKNNTLKLPKGLRLKIRGALKWNGKGRQGRLEIIHSDGRWRVYQAVSNIQPSHKPKGSKTCYIDLGVVNLITAYVDGMKQPIAYSGRSILNCWWYDTNRIAKYQSVLNKANGEKRSKRLSRMYLKRKRRFRHAVNAMIRGLMTQLYDTGVSTVNLGDLTGIRNDNNTTHRTNSMIHNFWSFDYTVRRIKDVAEEYQIAVKEVSEYKTSSICPRCGSENVTKHKRLFKCNDCKLEANRDCVGVTNIACLQGDKVNRMMTHPLLSKWDSKGMNTWRTRISPALAGRVSSLALRIC